MSPKEKKQFIKEVADVIEIVKKYKSGKLNEVSEDSLEKSLAALKQTALKAQRKWEKINENRLDEDDPKKDYGKYTIKNPWSQYALRNLPPTTDPDEIEKRKIQAKIEQLLKRAPSWWYDARRWKEMKPGATIYDDETGKGYVIGTGRQLTPKELIVGPYTEEELEKIPKEKLAASNGAAVVWVSSLLLLLRLLLAVI